MTLRLNGLACLMIGALCLAACGDDSGSSGGGSNSLVAKQLMCQGGSQTAQCEGMDEYVSCFETACKDALTGCLGANWKSGDYSGSVCEAYAKCGSTASDPCTCVESAECMSCFENMFTSCSLNNTCASKLKCGTAGTGASAGTGGSAGTGSSSSGKTCADLQTCCDGMSGSSKSACDSILMQIKAGAGAQADAACNSAYSGLCQ